MSLKLADPGGGPADGNYRPDVEAILRQAGNEDPTDDPTEFFEQAKSKMGANSAASPADAQKAYSSPRIARIGDCNESTT